MTSAQILSDIIAGVGTGMMIIGFFLNVIGWLGPKSYFYSLLNIIGGILAATGAGLIQFWPFVALESIWAIGGIYTLVKTSVES